MSVSYYLINQTRKEYHSFSSNICEFKLLDICMKSYILEWLTTDKIYVTTNNLDIIGLKII